MNDPIKTIALGLVIGLLISLSFTATEINHKLDAIALKLGIK